MLKLIACVVVAIALLGPIVGLADPSVSREKCIQKAVDALNDIRINEPIRKLMDILQANHEGSPFIMMKEITTKDRADLAATGFTGECESLLYQYQKILVGEEITCLREYQQDQEFKRMSAQNKQLDDLVGSVITCFNALRMD